LNVLVVGSGGREHAIAWKVSQSPLLDRLLISPGNPGTSALGENFVIPVTGTIPGSDDKFKHYVDFCLDKAIDLVIIGPEAPLADGLADELSSAGVAVFGPSKSAAQIESSKAFAKDFMTRHAIPTGRYAKFNLFEPALQYLRQSYQKHPATPLVIKASGLAAGKGVFIPDAGPNAVPSKVEDAVPDAVTRELHEAERALRQIMVEKTLGSAADEVILEEMLKGEEVSVLAFTDGFTVKVMPPARDHKRLLDGDRGPNTGGMGAYAPSPLSREDTHFIETQVLQRAVDGLRRDGILYKGVLYAGMILTTNGPQVLEFNCRFGDPETQVLLPLLETDLLEIAIACVKGRLWDLEIAWKPMTAACVVIASPNYPGTPVTGQPISGLDQIDRGTMVFHAGTKTDAKGQVLTTGGRVLGATGWGNDLNEALTKYYAVVEKIHFEGRQFRTDIGHVQWRNIGRQDPASAYTASGVSIDAGNLAVDLMRSEVQSTYGKEVLAGIGAFGGLYDASSLNELKSPILVASTDGVGTKVMLAAEMGSFYPVGRDLVNHCINDILVQGARPLFFLDYIASSHMDPEQVAQAVSGIASACREAGCALLGGETAEMPGVYTPGSFDLAGTIVGAVERENILPHDTLRPGDCLVGLRSSGAHTNGFTLIRKVFEGVPLETNFPELGTQNAGLSLGEALLAEHRSYLPLLRSIIFKEDSPVKALVHLTGGGFLENIPRILPGNLGALINRDAWEVPPLFTMIQERGAITSEEMYRVFNMGIGMIVIVAQDQVTNLQEAIPEETYLIGELVSLEASTSEQKVRIQ